MPADMGALADDLAAETEVLLSLLDGADWTLPTPAPGWTIADQVTHLAYFDDTAITSATTPEVFRADLVRINGSGGIDPDAIAASYRHLPAPAVADWLAGSRSRLIEVFRSLDPALRVPWFGPAMSAASALTARLMETWAHGQDIADTLGVTRVATDRLRHVAHIGVGARAFSYDAHGLPPATVPVRVELTGPGGDIWAWGPPDATDRVTGPARDFCLVVTRRRHRDDTAIRTSGPAADEWMSIAQAFAGAPGAGRTPGQFDREQEGGRDA